MGKKLTTAQFIERAIAKHGDLYDYTNSEYTGNKENFTAVCRAHGNSFTVIAANHLTRQGCPICAKASFACKLRATQEYFEKRLRDVHGDRYLSDKAKYKTNNTKVTLTCKIHGDFDIRPIEIYSGGGCRTCGHSEIGNKNRATTEEWVAKAISVHGSKYNYSKSNHCGKITKICIGCKNCMEDFYQRPSTHLSGAGCPSCTSNGYNRDKPGYIYILVNDCKTKIGITNRTPEIRLKEINRDFPGFTILYYKYYRNGGIPAAIETSLLWTQLMGGKAVEERFDGSTECFTEVDRDYLIEIVTGSGANLEREYGTRP